MFYNNYSPLIVENKSLLEGIFKKSLLGRYYYLRNNYFRDNILGDKYRENYTEIFRLKNNPNIRGVFEWNVTDDREFKRDLFLLKNKLQMYDIWNKKTYLIEILNIEKKELTLKFPPKYRHIIIQNDKEISVKEVDKYIFDLNTKEIIEYK